MAAGDSDNALLERFKLRSGKVRLADDKTLDIAAVGDVVLKTSFGTSWTLKDVRYIPGLKRRLISVGQLDEEGYHVHPEGIGAIIDGSGSAALWFGEAEEAFFHNVREDKETTKVGASYNIKAMALHLLHQSEDPATMILLSKTITGVAFGVVVRLSRTFRAESMRIRVEAPKILWADSVSTTYLIYRIPYVLIGLRIPEEEWRGKDTSLTHLKVFGCDSFVKVKDVCGEAMKCSFICSSSDEMRYSFQDTKSHQVIRSRDITFVDSIYEARSASDSSIFNEANTEESSDSPGGSSNTSEGSKNSVSFKDSRRSYEEDFEDGSSSKRRLQDSTCTKIYQRVQGSSKWKKAIDEEMVLLEKNQTYSLVRISAGK
ncbi:retrovirus-related pol polyprotein from transposon TNT 1-94, partial [Tanacetum coccineum]